MSPGKGSPMKGSSAAASSINTPAPLQGLGLASKSTGSQDFFQVPDAPVGTNPSPSGSYGCGLSNEGLLYTKGSVEDARITFAAGDVIGVGVDQ